MRFLKRFGSYINAYAFTTAVSFQVANVRVPPRNAQLTLPSSSNVWNVYSALNMFFCNYKSLPQWKFMLFYLQAQPVNLAFCKCFQLIFWEVHLSAIAITHIRNYHQLNNTQLQIRSTCKLIVAIGIYHMTNII